MDDLRPATAVLAAGVGAILAADVWLMARGLAPVTATLRTRGGRLFVVALAGHVAGVLGPADPFRLLAAVGGWWAARAVQEVTS